MIILNQEQKQQLQEIIEKLRELRIEKSILLEEIADQTHIRLAYLQALELFRFEELPEPIFIQGFIRHYADYLGLDGSVWANKFTVSFPPIVSESNQQNLSGLHIYIPLLIPYVVLLLVAATGLFYLLKTDKTSPKPQSSNILLMYDQG